MTDSRIYALIPAAGLSQRFGADVPKQYARLRGRPLLAHAIAAVQRHPAVAGITVALSPDDRYYESMLRAEFPDVMTVAGGATRARSVLNALRYILALPEPPPWVLVHDAARPCLPRTSLDDLISAGLSSPDGAILAVPLSDTIKRSGRVPRVEETVDREGLWRAQTPQMFPAVRLATAIAESLDAGIEPTDESAAMERLGLRPLLVAGSELNIKITRPDDLVLADGLIAALLSSGGEQT